MFLICKSAQIGSKYYTKCFKKNCKNINDNAFKLRTRECKSQQSDNRLVVCFQSPRDISIQFLAFQRGNERDEMPNNMRVIIVAAGLGSRLGSLTRTDQNAVGTHGKSILQHQLDVYNKANIADIPL